MIRVWYSRDGDAMGLPWCVQKSDGSVERAAEFLAGKSNVRTCYSPDGLANVPDGPKAWLEVDSEEFMPWELWRAKRP